MSQPKAVFWDIGGVILNMQSVRAGHTAFVTTLLDEYDISTHPDEALSIWRDELGAYFAETEGTNYRPAREGYRRAIRALAGTDDIDWEPLFRAVTTEQLEPNPGAVETIHRIAREPLHQGVISDVDDEEGKQILDAFGVLESMDSVTTSEAVGRKKPDAAMFETALKKAGVDPHHAVMIGDRYSHDMRGGRDAGMITVAYGAEDGPAVDYKIEKLREVLAIIGIDDDV